MTLDTLTVQVVAGAVVILSASLFVAEAWVRRATAVDRLWSLGFAAAITAALASLADALQPFWLARALSNAAQVGVLWLMWSGVRADAGRRPLSSVPGLAAAAAALGVIVAGPDGDPWAGGGLLLVGVASGGLAAGIAILRSPLRRFGSGGVLAALMFGMGAYYAVRLAVYAAVGPYSPTFERYVGTEATTILLALVVNGAAFSMVTLRTRTTAQDVLLAENFDAATGARTPASFEPRAAATVEACARAAQPVALVVVTPDDVGTIRVAFGRDDADRALVLCGEVVSILLPPRALLGLDAAHGSRFEVLLVGMAAADAAAWAAGVREELLDNPLDVPGSRMRLTVSVGVADASDAGYDLPALRAAARAAAGQAVAHGGNRVDLAHAG